MRKIRETLQDNSGAALGEALAAFVIVCFGVIMLVGCMVMAINIIGTTRTENKETQEKVNTFWAAESPDTTATETVTVKSSKGNVLGSFTVTVNGYKVSDDETYYEYEKATGN